MAVPSLQQMLLVEQYQQQLYIFWVVVGGSKAYVNAAKFGIKRIIYFLAQLGQITKS